MAKNMARIENGSVINLEWYSDNTTESDALKDTKDRPVSIGDTYESGKFYRDGVEVLTPLEETYVKLAQYETELADAENALKIMLGGNNE